jgi:hypothetical protein
MKTIKHYLKIALKVIREYWTDFIEGLFPTIP